MLAINFRMVHDKNHINAQNAGLKHFSKTFLCIYSHINAQMKGHVINQIGHKNNHIIIPIIHHRFPRFVHQNFLVHRMGR